MLSNAHVPIATLLEPVVTSLKASKPTAVLLEKLPPEEMHPFPTFPYRLEYQDGKTPESVTSNVKNTEINISNDTDSEKTNTTATTLPKDPIIPSLMFLGVILATLSVIVLGYFKGNMHLLTTLKNAREFYS